ncbi:MAG: restriction endonuclease subunit S, partial [Candidatus Methanoperedens sp.]|nr:restriction endonuclease subunit S [Candidatus Methanoperedens sp.]
EILKSGAKYEREKLGNLMSLKRDVLKLENFNPDYRLVEKIRFKDGAMILRKYSETGIDLQFAEIGDLLISKINFHQGATAINNYGKVLTSLDYLVYEVDRSKAIPEFVHLMVRDKYFIRYVNESKPGGIKGRSKPEFIETLEIPLPSNEEQTAIVAQIEKQKAIIEGTEKIVGNWSVDFDSYLIKHDFSQKPISELIIDSLYGSSEKADYQDDGYNVLRIGNIGFCDFKLDDLKKSVLSEKEFKKYELKKGDFLIVRSNGNPNLVGKCAVWDLDIPFIYASYLIRFRFRLDEIEPKYVMYYLMSPKGKSLLNPTAGGGTYNISATDFKKVQIPYPIPDIQRQIVSELDSQMQILEGLRKMKTEAEKKIS